MPDIPSKFQSLAKARAKLIEAESCFKAAQQASHEDRHLWAGKINETQKQMNQLLDEMIEMVSQEESDT
jgi:hypothetical protein